VENHRELNIVTGAFGYTGKYLTRLLLKRGIAVRTLTNHRPRTSPYGEAVEALSFNFDDPDKMAESLGGATTVFNTYWIRFERGELTFDRATRNVERLIEAAKRARVRRFVHIGIANASVDSPLPYFRGKGMIEQFLRDSRLSHAIIRPTVIFGDEDILINNIAWSLRRFPIFAIPGDGNYRVQPVFVEDVAKLAVNAAQQVENVEIDAVGPETYTFNDLVRKIGEVIGRPPRLVHVNPTVALAVSSAIGWAMHDVMLTRDEIRGLSANLLMSSEPYTAPTRLSEWLTRHRDQIGLEYASELARRR
jgi:uncharacterized protein YbjT (DUF2867 family)